MPAPTKAKDLTTFVGFWPAQEIHGAAVGSFELDEHGVPTSETQKALRQTLVAYEGSGWRMRITCDFLVLLHLERLEPELKKLRELEKLQMPPAGFWSTTTSSWIQYLQALNAWYFTIFAAAQTGRNSSFLHDFGELRFWDCERVLYDEDDQANRHASYSGRAPGTWLARMGLRVYESEPSRIRIEKGIFADAAVYFDTLHANGLLELGALGTKIISEYRSGNNKAVVALTWFELEAWINMKHAELGFAPKRKTKRSGMKTKDSSEKIADFPDGTSIGRFREQLDDLRTIRNDVVHENRATQADGKLAIQCYLEMLFARSGIVLQVDLNSPPTVFLA